MPQSKSLSTTLLILTVIFVFVAEILVMIPSVAKHRVDWLSSRVEAAYLVGVALEGAEERMIDEPTAQMLFSTANILGVTVNDGERRLLILAPEINPHSPREINYIDLDDRMPLKLIADGWGALLSDGEKLLQVTGTPQFVQDERIDIVVDQSELRKDLLLYARNILILSLIISSLTASLLFYALNRIIVSPVQSLTNSMMRFEADPDEAARIHSPGQRNDEIGVAEKSLAAMQTRLFDLLTERKRLAALGAGISKITHDLRNILASAQLMSDRLAKSDDPRVRKLAPRLLSALDRAIVLSRDTLTYGNMDARNLKKEHLILSDLVEEVLDDVAHVELATVNDVPSDITIIADRTQLYRSLFNLARNAVEAMIPNSNSIEGTDAPSSEPAHRLTVDAKVADGNTVQISIADNGPGVPAHASDHLFEPFKGSQKPGGSGLGVAISAEIIRAHGGEIKLADNSSDGAVFTIDLPGVAPQVATTAQEELESA